MVEDTKIQERVIAIEQEFKALQKVREDTISKIHQLQGQDQEIVQKQLQLRGEYQGLQRLLGVTETPLQVERVDS